MDRATGEYVETGSEMRVRKATHGGNACSETTEDVDNLVSTNEVDEEVHPNNFPKRASISHSEDATSSRTKKRAKRVAEDNTILGDIAITFRKLVEVFEMSTIELIKQNKNASTEDIWARLEDIGVEPSSFPHVYIHLVQHPEALKAFNGVPIHMRKEMLPYIVPGYPFYQ